MLRYTGHARKAPFMRDPGQTWQDRAACKDNGNPDLWFPEIGDEKSKDAAQKICRTCWVRLECLRFDMTMPEPQHGIWGGLTKGQRSRLRNLRNRLRRRRPDGTDRQAA